MMAGQLKGQLHQKNDVCKTKGMCIQPFFPLWIHNFIDSLKVWLYFDSAISIMFRKRAATTFAGLMQT